MGDDRLESDSEQEIKKRFADEFGKKIDWEWDLQRAINLTETALRNCDTPTLKDLYKKSIIYYKDKLDRFRSLRDEIEKIRRLKT